MSEDGSSKATQEVFKQYVASVLPFMSHQQSETDQKLREVMKRETSKGLIVFNAPKESPLTQRAKAMSMPDEIRKKLAKAGKTRIVEL